MKSPYFFIVSPKQERYNNIKKIGEVDLVLNTDISNHKFISKEAIVKYVPQVYKHDINVGDEVITHHNIFRRWYNMRGEEKNSRSYISENTYFLSLDQIYLYRSNSKSKWKCLKGYCFIKPIKSQETITINKEHPLIGVVKYTDGSVSEGDLIGFSPGDEFEFIVDGEKLYAVMSKFISIKYEYQGNEKEYNPSWA
jgi:hypothetical protein|tara:strand:- start:178 stop:765 length:588 start_codon:yes stop_codon:yes gene_type:complete